MIGCGHCDAILKANPYTGERGAWQVAREKMRGARGNVLIAEVESGNRGILPTHMHAVNGFPAIIAYGSNTAVEYNGDRSPASFVAFISKFTIPNKRPAPVRPVIKPVVKPAPKKKTAVLVAAPKKKRI